MSSTRASQSSPYLFKSRHGVWYARVVVPEDQRSAIGKRELRKSLSTKDKWEAVRRSWGVLQQLMLVAKGKALAQPMEDTSERTPSSVAISVEASPPVVNKPKLPKLSEVTELFCQEKIRQQAWSTHSEYVNRKTFKDMITLLGDIRLDEFTKEKALRYKQHYSNNGKISITTVNKYLTRVISFMQWVSAHYGTPNPMIGMSIKVAKVKASKERVALSQARIKQLFNHLPANSNPKYPYRYWLPRLAAYTGARLGELAQLYLDDFDVIDGHPCILIRATHKDQALKTAHSERVIPIHPQLIKLGFLKFIEHLRSNGHQRLFPEIKKQAIRGYSHQVSRWFHVFKGHLNWSEKETFHGIRHAVATQLKQKEFNSDMVAGLLGHSHGSITFDRYGKEYNIANMLRLIQALEW